MKKKPVLKAVAEAIARKRHNNKDGNKRRGKLVVPPAKGSWQPKAVQNCARGPFTAVAAVTKAASVETSAFKVAIGGNIVMMDRNT